MKKRRKSAYKGYKGRSRHRRAAVVVLAAAVLLLGAAAGIYFGGLFPRIRDLIPRREPSQQVEPAPDDNPEPAPGGDPDPVPDDNPEPTPDPDPGPGYAVIEISGEKQEYEALYRVGDTGFEYFTYVPELGQKYAEAVNKAADALKGTAAVYDITVPLSSSVGLPDAMAGMEIFGDQKGAEEEIASLMDENVRTVPLYETLMQHRGEYIYYRTDHHWTALGAYYAYCQFCQTRGVEPHALTDYVKDEYPGFLGSFYRDSGENKEMGKHPDVLEAYHPVSQNAELDLTDTEGKTYRWQIIMDVTDYDADMKYNGFIGGDNPYTVIRNPDLTDGSCCVVVKESFGNAFVPYLVDHYQTVHVIDYRYWEGKLTDFVKSSGAQDVIFINNLSAIRNSFLMGRLQGIV
jgi:hypothetical protein